MNNKMFINYLLLLFIVFISCDRINSPIDGKAIPSGEIAFISIREGHTIVLANVDGSHQFPITDRNEYHADAQFSPDGRYMLYSASLPASISRSIYLYNICQTEVLIITDDTGNDTEPSFSHDGNKIVFVSDRGGNLNWNIYIFILINKQMKQITFDDQFHNPIFSPDDSKILFSRYYNDLNHLCVIDTNGTNYKELDSQVSFFTNYQFSTHGDNVYYTDPEGNLISTDLFGNRQIIIAADSSQSISSFVIPSIDSVIYFCSLVRPNETILYYSLSKYNIIKSQKTILKTSSEILTMGDCSLDGTKILYSNFVNGLGDIFYLNLQTGIDVNLTRSEYHDYYPIFNKPLFVNFP